MKYNINMVDDLFRILDQYVDGVAGDKFYMERNIRLHLKITSVLQNARLFLLLR